MLGRRKGSKGGSALPPPRCNTRGYPCKDPPPSGRRQGWKKGWKKGKMGKREKEGKGRRRTRGNSPRRQPRPSPPPWPRRRSAPAPPRPARGPSGGAAPRCSHGAAALSALPVRRGWHPHGAAPGECGTRLRARGERGGWHTAGPGCAVCRGLRGRA